MHNYYAEPEDRRSMIDGTRVGLEIAAQPAMRAHIAQPYRAPEIRLQADIWEYLQRYTQTIFHPTSTCAIGPVVDQELRVHGFEGLRVVDASVMPSIVRGNTNAPTIMIAERAADLIRDARGLTWSLRRSYAVARFSTVHLVPRTTGFASPTIRLSLFRIRCCVCSRRGSYRLARLAAKFGPVISLRDRTDRFSYDCRWRAEARSKKGKSACGVYLPDLEQPRPLDAPPGMVKLRLVKKT